MAINTLYLDGSVLKSASNIYNNENPRNIRLDNLFQKAVFELLKKKFDDSVHSLKFHPYKYKYLTIKAKEVHSFIHGDYFSRLIKLILKIDKYKIKYEIRKFGPGNYTLLHDAEKEKIGVDFFIDFSECDANFGGYTVYLNKKKELLTLNPKSNSLSFVERKGGMMKFTKYVTHQQKNPVVQVVGTIFNLV